MNPTLEAIAASLKKASSPEDVFGDLAGSSKDDRLHSLTSCFRSLAKSVHPDKWNGTLDERLAVSLFQQISSWRVQAETKVEAGTYGDRSASIPSTPPILDPQVIKTPKREYMVTKLVAQGDIADLYACTYQDKGVEQRAIMKVVQSAADNDLLQNEAKILGAIYPIDQKEERFYRYLVKLHDSFLLKGKGTNRRVNVLQFVEGSYTLEDVRKAYPGGLDYRDVVWMYKRMLAAIGYLHSKKGVIHGAMLPTHVMVHPENHGAKLVGWSYAIDNWRGRINRIKALSSPWKHFYAPEVLSKQPPVPATDIYMASKCAMYMLGDTKIPNQIKAFLDSCLFSRPERRPDDAWKLHEEFDNLLERLVGKPRYRKLVLPTRS